MKGSAKGCHIKSPHQALLPGLIFVAIAAGPGQLLANDSVPLRDATACPAVNADPNNIRDYRMRDSNSTQKWGIEDNIANHMGPVIARMRAGDYSRRVMEDINFTLVHWPNHLVALQALVKYDLAGGKSYEFPSVACQFARARQYDPDDVAVVLVEAYYHWKKGDTAGAIASYQEALKIDPDSADAHYNLGLMYLNQRNYVKANAEAQIAYGAGYPLPGLAEKLAAAGYPAAAASAQRPKSATSAEADPPTAPAPAE
jgi:tetratricopeptide (TPR) repeat protein